MAEGSAEALEATLKQNQFLGRKFLAVKQRPHIKTMTSDTLTTEIDRHGHDPADLMDGDKLKVTGDDVQAGTTTSQRGPVQRWILPRTLCRQQQADRFVGA